MVWFSVFIHSVIIIQALDFVALPIITPDGEGGYTYPTCSNLFPDCFPGAVLLRLVGEVDELHRGVTLGVDAEVARHSVLKVGVCDLVFGLSVKKVSNFSLRRLGKKRNPPKKENLKVS
jgi:hypothetical protein